MTRVSLPKLPISCYRAARLLTTHAAPLLVAVVVAVLSSTSGRAQWGGHHSEMHDWQPGGAVQPVPLEPDVVERLLAAYDERRYADFDRLAGPLVATLVNPFEFEADADRWIAAGADRRRRAFVAAAVALELATVPLQRDGAIVFERNAIDARFVLAELGCAWLREHPPSVAERSWHAAFVALARATSREGYVIAIAPWGARMARLSGLHEKDIRSLVEQFEREDRVEETHRRRVHAALLGGLRRDAARVSGATRLDASRWQFEHSRHLLARFPDDPHPSFLEAIVLDSMRANYGETLLDAWFNPVWLDAEAIDQLVAGGPRAIRAVPRNSRMDQQSAGRLLRVVPQEAGGALSQGYPFQDRSGAPFTSLALWDIVGAFQAVPARAPVAAETALRLGQNYVRLARPDLALPAFIRAEALATTPYEQYLARLFAGAAFMRIGRRPEAMTAFQGALHAVPRAQSASLALASLLLEQDAWDEAAGILEAAMTPPLPDDPLDYYYWSDPAAVPRALAQLREEARP